LVDADCCLKQTNNAKHVKAQVFVVEVMVAILVKARANSPVLLAMDLEHVLRATQLDRALVVLVQAPEPQLSLYLRHAKDAVVRAKLVVQCVMALEKAVLEDRTAPYVTVQGLILIVSVLNVLEVVKDLQMQLRSNAQSVKGMVHLNAPNVMELGSV
jgi:hypothetical protein